MTHRTLFSLGLSALVFGTATVGCAGGGGGVASVGTRAMSSSDAAVRKALASRDPAAVTLAEAAVAAGRADANRRMLLGQSYIQAGRFQSARDAFADALSLAPDNGRAALNLALAQIATGDWRGARQTLDTHGGTIAPSDRGLAIALAGDPGMGVQLLMAAARQPGADAKLRQNLGLALALAGQWPLARAVAAADMSPADVDRRMEEWAAFAQPTQASDQVAALLGVRAAADGGQPVTLALSAPVPVVPVSAAEAVMALPEIKPAAVAVAPVSVAIPAAVARPVLSASAITFAPRQEVVQALPVPLLRADGPAKVALAATRPAMFRPLPASSQIAAPARSVAYGAGEWMVQLGAFENAAVARDAWTRIARRYTGLAGQKPRGVGFRTGGDEVYRLSVGGFDRAGADGICRRVRTGGGACFVRRAAGDRLAQWIRPGTQLASR